MNINATLFVQMAVFFIGAWVTMKFIWPPLIRALDERQKKIADGLAAADKGNRSLDDAQKKIAQLDAEARSRAQALMAEPVDEADSLGRSVDQLSGPRAWPHMATQSC